MHVRGHRSIWIWALVGNLSFAHADGGFEDAVRPVLDRHCVDCHGQDKQNGDVRFDRFDGEPAAETELWLKVLEQLQAGKMPPKKKPRPSEHELAALRGWIDEHAGKAALAFREKMQRPENANLVPHDKLFDPKTAESGPEIAASPARLWRTLPQSYEAKQEAWLKERGVQVAMRNGQGRRYGYFPAPFGLHGEHELKNYSFRYTLEASQTEGVANNARVLLALVIEADPRGKSKTLIRDLARSEDPPKPEDIDRVITEQYQHWLGRDPEGAELERRRAKISTAVGKFGNREGLIFGLVPIMIHPEVFYHTEFGIAGTGGEPAFLSPEEIVDSIDRALRDRRDDPGRNPSSQWQIGYGNPMVRDFLAVRADKGKLNSRADVIAALDEASLHKRIPKLSQSETVKRFLEEYFNYTHYFQVFKDIGELQKEKDAGRLFGTFAEHFNNGHPEQVVRKTRGVIDKIWKRTATCWPACSPSRPTTAATPMRRSRCSSRSRKIGLENGIAAARTAPGPDRRPSQLPEDKREGANTQRDLARSVRRPSRSFWTKHPDWLAPDRIGVLKPAFLAGLALGQCGKPSHPSRQVDPRAVARRPGARRAGDRRCGVA